MSEKKITVCHLVYGFNVGGLERIIVNCINNTNSNEYRHIIISLTNVGDFLGQISYPVDYFELNKKNGNDPSLYIKLYKLLRNLKPDVLHSYNLGTLEYHWVAMLARVPLRIHAEHGRDSYDPDGAVSKYRWLRKITSVALHKVVAVSDDLNHWLLDEVKLSKKKVILIPNGIDTHFYAPQNYEHSNILTFGHVARLHAIKDQLFFLKAYSEACKVNKNFATDTRLVIVGDGPDKEKLEEYVSEQPEIIGQVSFEGARTNVKDYYQEFDVFLMSSIAEGIPMTLLESMSMGVPHLVTRVGGINEVIIDGLTGLSVNPQDFKGYVNSMLELYSNSEMREKMSQAARQRVQSTFSQDIMVSSYDAIYKRKTR
ncbi:glycosyltransferase [Vibrio sp.]|nr:glycosyltransferase [Vibrio sp.]